MHSSGDLDKFLLEIVIRHSGRHKHLTEAVKKSLLAVKSLFNCFRRVLLSDSFSQFRYPAWQFFFSNPKF